MRLQAAELGYKFYEHMRLFDPKDRREIEWGLRRVFGDPIRINRAIAAQISPDGHSQALAQVNLRI
jgi:hypothetical protein